MAACSLCGGDPKAEVFGSYYVSWPSTLSQNRSTVNRGAERWSYAKTRQAWRVMAAHWSRGSAIVGAARAVPFATSKRRLVVTREAPRMLDPANLVGGMKAMLDALVLERLLVDDSERYLELHSRQVRSSGVEPTLTLGLSTIEMPGEYVTDTTCVGCHKPTPETDRIRVRAPAAKTDSWAHTICILAGQRKRRRAMVG